MHNSLNPMGPVAQEVRFKAWRMIIDYSGHLQDGPGVIIKSYTNGRGYCNKNTLKISGIVNVR